MRNPLSRLLVIAAVTLFGHFGFAPEAVAQLGKSARWAVEAYVEYGFLEADITYAKVSERELKLDVYKPRGSKAGVHPTLMFIHGGGWRAGTKNSYSLRVLPWLEKGWAVVNIDYRVTSMARAPAAVEDARCALRWVHANAEKYGFDRELIVVSGQSAGGHLALMTGLAADDERFDSNCPGEKTAVLAVVNWFGITDVGDLLSGQNKTQFASNWIGEDRFEDRELIESVSPLSHVSTDDPPVITIHGDKDPLVPYNQAFRLHQSLKEKGVGNELITIKGGDHGDFSAKESVRAYESIFKFLDKAMRAKSKSKR
ncbi:MAG: alpha/beta hydrolase [Pyrinomonadaceae bacterium]